VRPQKAKFSERLPPPPRDDAKHQHGRRRTRREAAARGGAAPDPPFHRSQNKKSCSFFANIAARTNISLSNKLYPATILRLKYKIIFFN
jgi:hypothetical protein